MGKIYLYPYWVRLWHLVNAVMCLILIVTGLCMQYSNPDYSLIPFNVAVSAHNISGIILTVSYFVFFFGNFFTSNGKYYMMKKRGAFKRLLKQLRYYAYGMFKGEKAPYKVSAKRKFNPMQKLSYILIMYIIVPVIFLTGWALLIPDLIIIDQIFGTSGIHFTDLLHIVSGFALSVFMAIHIYFCTISSEPGANFRAMISGWH